MRTILPAFSCLILAAIPAAALEKELVDQIVQSAQSIGRDASGVSTALKTKRFDAAEVTKQISAMDGDVAKLQELVAGFDSTHPNLSERDRADWHLLKLKVQLIELFHGQKKNLAAEGVAKNRDVIRAHASGLAERAQKLQQTAEKLRRG